MNVKRDMLEAFTQALKETPAGFFKPAVAAFVTVLEPIKASPLQEKDNQGRNAAPPKKQRRRR